MSTTEPSSPFFKPVRKGKKKENRSNQKKKTFQDKNGYGSHPNRTDALALLLRLKDSIATEPSSLSSALNLVGLKIKAWKQ
jgi:hypothetical protein